MKEPLTITGIWHRVIAGRCEVLVEIDDEWRVVSSEKITDRENNMWSVITETRSKDRWPADPITRDNRTTSQPPSR